MAEVLGDINTSDILNDDKDKFTSGEEWPVENVAKKTTETGPAKGKTKPTKKSAAGSQVGKFSEEELMNLAEAFALSDISTGRSGAISAKEVTNAMRRLGQCPTQLEVQEVIIEVEMLKRSRHRGNEAKKKKGERQDRGKRPRSVKKGCDIEQSDEDKIDFPEFLTIVEKKGKELETEENIIDAFRVFDVKGNGLISSKKLRKIMMGMGEELSQDEVEEMIKQAECYNGDGKVKYEKFVKMMMMMETS